MSTSPDEWIGVAEVADELRMTHRAAWELIRRLGVPRLEPGRAVMASARFRRSDWEAARDASVKPPEPRARVAAAASTPATPRRSATVTTSKLRRS